MASGPGGLSQTFATGSITLAGTQPNTFTGGVFVVDGGQTLKGMTGPHELRAFRRERKR